LGNDDLVVSFHNAEKYSKRIEKYYKYLPFVKEKLFKKKYH
jgi:hypothetical protein